MNTLFAEKYRPETLSEIVGQEHITNFLKEYVKNKDIPHMLFAGLAGCGKTSAAKALAHDLYGDDWKSYFLEINASDDRGIDVVRDKIKNYARIKILGQEFKIIHLDEADAMCLTGDTEIIIGTLKNPRTIRLDKITSGKKSILSINPNTLKVENDKGRLVDSGYADFFKVILENGSIIKASEKHPFFKIKRGKLVEIKLKDLFEGDEIVELVDEVYNKCKICGKYTFNKNCCSIECQNKHHALKMKGEGNPLYGKKWSKERRKKIIDKLTDGRLAGKNNPNYGSGIWYGKQIFRDGTEEEKRILSKKISESKLGISYKELFGERALEERVKRNPTATKQRILTNDWLKEQLKGDTINCQICNKSLKTKGKGKDVVYVHHVDHNQKNHVPDNLLFVCPYCHNMVCHNSDERLKKGREIAHNKKAVHNGIKIVKIESIGKQKAWNISIERNKNFILKNGVVTHNTNDAQQALRRIIEMNSDKCRFILSCNYPNKIIDPIIDRCVSFRFKAIKTESMIPMLKKVAEGENIDITNSAISTLATLSNGSMRRALNTLQKLKLGNVKNITDATIYDSIAYVNDDHIKSLLIAVRKGDTNVVDDFMDSLLNVKTYAPAEIIESLRRLIKGSTKLSMNAKLDALEMIGEIGYRISVGSSPELQLKTYCVYLIRLYMKEAKE